MKKRPELKPLKTKPSPSAWDLYEASKMVCGTLTEYPDDPAFVLVSREDWARLGDAVVQYERREVKP